MSFDESKSKEFFLEVFLTKDSTTLIEGFFGLVWRVESMPPSDGSFFLRNQSSNFCLSAENLKS